MREDNEDNATIERLVLIYNADSGRLAAWIDNAFKIFGAGQCALCDITHGLRGEKSEWAEYRRELGIPVEALHRDELGHDELAELVEGQLPCVVAKSARGLEIVLGPDVLARCRGSVANFRSLLATHAAIHGLTLRAATG